MKVCPEVTGVYVAENPWFVKESKVLGEAGEVGRISLLEKGMI